jgi:hypothetical protein
MISPAFAAALEADRERLNALFARARRDAPTLDAAVFLHILRGRIDPLLCGAHQGEHDQGEHDQGEHDQGERRGVSPTYACAGVLYEVALELYRKGCIGPEERHPGFESRWSRLMEGTAAAISVAPRELIGPLTNAQFNLTVTPGCRADDWVQLVGRVAQVCAKPTGLLQAAQVAAWLCGMAHYRSQAIALARALPEPVLERLFPQSADRSDARAILDRLQADPWYYPGRKDRPPGLQVVAEVGNFRGLGGEFRRPPHVAASQGQLLLTDGCDQWWLFADSFGAVMHRAGRVAAESKGRGAYGLGKDGVVKGPRSEAKMPWLARASSYAATESTLAVTLPHSHRVFLISEVGP